jgi:hypothetical protein
MSSLDDGYGKVEGAGEDRAERRIERIDQCAKSAGSRSCPKLWMAPAASSFPLSLSP